MAGRGEELNTRLTVTDQISATLDRVQAEMADLEDRPHEVDVTADTSDAVDEIGALDSRLKGLTAEERRVILSVQAKDAQLDLDRINRDLARADKYDDDEIAIQITAKGDAERRLESIQSEIRQIDGATPDVRPSVDSSELDQFIDKLDNLAGGRLGALGGLRGAGGPAALAGAVTAGWIAAGDAAADAAIDIDNISKLTGDTVENASRLAGIWKQSGAETKDLQDVLLQMGGVLTDDVELAAQLGINLNDGKTLGERFLQVVALLPDKFEDASERSIVASRLFGEEGVRQVNAVTAAYPDLIAAVDEYNGKVFTQEEIARARDYKREVNELKAEFEALKIEVGSGAVPALSEFLGGLNDISGWLDNNTGRNIGQTLLGVITGNPLVGLFDDGASAADNLADGLNTRTVPAIGAAARAARQLGDDAEAGMDRATTATGNWRDAVTDPAIRNAFIDTHSAIAPVVDSMEDLEAAATRYVEAFDPALQQLDDLKTKTEKGQALDRLAEQFERIKAEPGDDAAVRRLILDVLDLASTYDDLPAEKVTRIGLLLEQGQINAAYGALQDLVSGWEINLKVNPPTPTTDQVTFHGDGRAPTVQTAPAPSQTNNFYTVNPTPRQVDQLERDYIYANGARVHR